MESVATEPVSATYHVFINHRGPDVKKTLASLIYHRLTTCHGLRVFLDQKELHTGDALSPAILGAIQSASVHIAIFSRRYAESRWCLDELCWILEKRNRKIIPVFCDVEPNDLRHVESGSYKDAFKQHQYKRRVATEHIEKSKKALNKASEISGVLCKTNESDFGEVLERIVKVVLKEVESELFEVAKYPLGLDEAVEEINNEIKKQSELNIGTSIVGIAGMAGLGKSTLATYLYNLKRSEFRRSSFLSGIRKGNLPSLQRKLLQDLLGCDFHIEDTRQGKGIFRDRLQGLQVLIVLDDADHMEQINSLLVADVVGSRSLILITSRDRDLLRRSSAKTILYNVKPLQREHARELFCWHAFCQSKPYKGFEYLVEEVLKFCSGLPLSLKVLGAQFLGKREEDYWQRQLEKLWRRLPDDIMDTLKVSYEALKREEKEIFLDIGCFMVGEDRELAAQVLEGLGYDDVLDCLESLRQKCLLQYHLDVESDDESECTPEKPIGDDYNFYLPHARGRYKISMHDQIRSLARRYAMEEFRTPNPLRLSCSDDIQKMLLLRGGAESYGIRGIRTQKGQNQAVCTKYLKGVGVRLLVVEVEVPIDLLSGDLVWLRFSNFSSVHLPHTISLRNLRVLELYGHGDMEQLFQRFNMRYVVSRVLTNLRSTHPSTSSSSGSFDIKGLIVSNFFRFLEWIGRSIKFPSKIVLKNITSLQVLPIAFRELKSLRHLDLSGCTNLTRLPNSFSELRHLQYLALRDCINLSIPVSLLGEISTLEYVDFKGCSKLLYLPSGIPNQRSLRYLNLLGTHLKLPLNLELPDRLEQLRIGSSHQLRLGSSHRTDLPDLPESLGDLRPLKALKVLVLIECLSLWRILPDQIAGQGTNIEVLVIRRCPIKIFSFEKQETMHCGMGVLRDFTLSGTFITEIYIPKGVLPSLETLDLSENKDLMRVKVPSTLVRLNLQGCWLLNTLINLSNLVDLKFLTVNRCFKLETLNIEGLTSLEEIQAEAWWELKSIQGLSQRERLKCLRISTNTHVIWNDICNFLTSASHEKLSTAFFSGKLGKSSTIPRIGETAFYEIVTPEIHSIAGKFNVRVVDFVFAASPSEFHAKMEEFQSYGAILMCFLTFPSPRGHRQDLFRVRFEANHEGGSFDEYKILVGYPPFGSSGLYLHVFMWTEQSDLFRDFKCYNNISVSCNLHPEDVKKGCIIMVDKDTKVSQVCNEIIIAFS